MAFSSKIMIEYITILHYCSLIVCNNVNQRNTDNLQSKTLFNGLLISVRYC